MEHKWIISRHTRDMGLLIEVSLLIKKYQSAIDEEDKLKILKELEEAQNYSPRFGSAKKSTLASKIKGQIGYLKVVFSILIAIDVPIVGWLFQRALHNKWFTLKNLTFKNS